MSEKMDEGAEPESTDVTLDESAPEGEAHSRRRALVILVIVVVLALVAALVLWSVTSGSSPRAGASASPSATSEESAAPSPSETPGEGETPAGEDPDGGTVSDDIRPFDDDADIGGGVTVALSDLESVDGEAQGPGEISGPSIRFTVTFTNDGDEAYSLAGAVTNVYYGADRVPAIPLPGPGGAPFPAEVDAGKTATGTFIFNVPTDQRDTVRITVDYEAADPALVFEGAAPQ